MQKYAISNVIFDTIKNYNPKKLIKKKTNVVHRIINLYYLT